MWRPRLSLCDLRLKHVYPLAIRAYPGGAVAHAPSVFLHAVVTDGKAALTIPAEGQGSAAGVTCVGAFGASAAVPGLLGIFLRFL